MTKKSKTESDQLPTEIPVSTIIQDTLAWHEITLSKNSTPTTLSGGLTNPIYKITTTTGDMVVKITNKSSARNRNKQDRETIERFKRFLNKEQQIPVILAKRRNMKVVKEYDTCYAMVYEYFDGEPLSGPIGPVDPKYAAMAGELLGKIHANSSSWLPESTSPQTATPIFEFSYDVDLNELATLLQRHPKLSDLLSTAKKSQTAYARSRADMIYCHGDFLPHNLLLGNDSQLRLINFELAGLLNRRIELFVACITFSGFATDDKFRKDSLKYFLHAYSKEGCTLHGDIDDATWGAIHKCWVNWIAFNLKQDNLEPAEIAYASLQTLLNRLESFKLIMYELISEIQPVVGTIEHHGLTT